MLNNIEKLTALGPEDGSAVSIMGGTYRLLIRGKDTGGAFAVIEMLVPPQGGPGPHEHAGFHESYYVVDGEVLFQFESESFTAKKGASLNVPKGGGVHRFKNVSDTTAHLLCTVVPAGLDDFFLEVGQPVAAGTFLPPPVMEPEEQKKLQAIAEKHGQKLYPPDYLDK